LGLQQTRTAILFYLTESLGLQASPCLCWRIKRPERSCRRWQL